MGKSTFWTALEVAKIAAELIARYHQHLQEDDVVVRYAFQSDTSKSKGKEVWGKAHKITGLDVYLAGEQAEFFIITISEPVWKRLTEKQKVALVDHELCHLWTEWDEEKEERKLTLLPHDLEEFAAIVRRHGDWCADVRQFLAQAREGGQLSMDLLVA